MKKLKLILGLIGVCAVTAYSASAQSATEIVKKHNDAIGGTSNWAKLTSMKKTGTMSMQGTEIPTSQTVLKGKGMKQEFTIQGVNNYIILTPTAGWSFMPIQGQTKAEPLPADQLKGMADQLDFQDELMGAADKKAKIEMAGKEDLNGASCYKLKVTQTDGTAETFWVDASNYYTVQTEKKADIQGQSVDQVIKYGDFKKVPEGIVVPMKEDTGATGIFVASSIELNTIKDDSIFKPQ